MGGAARGHRGRRPARRDLRARGPRRRVELGVVAPGARTPGSCGTGSELVGFVWLSVRPGRARGAQDRPVGRGAAEPPAPGHRHPAVRVGRCSAATEIAPTLDADAPDQARDRRRRAPGRPAGARRADGPRAGAPLPGDRPADGASRSPDLRRAGRPRAGAVEPRARRGRRASPTSRPSPTTGGASPARPRSGRSGTRATAASVPTCRCSPSIRRAGRWPALVLCAAYPQDWVTVPGRGVDQHGRHPAGLARQGRGVAG